MPRLRIERQHRLEPKRIEYAVQQIESLGYEIIHRDALEVRFIHKGHIVTFFPYSGWATGKTIKDGRGIANLIKQLKQE